MSLGEKFEVIADEVYAKGREDERVHFWSDFPTGWCIQYCLAYSSWTDDIYKPIKDIVVPERTYYSCLFYGSYITDTKVALDLSACLYKYTGGCTQVFRESNIKTIRKIIVNETITYFNWFKDAKKLENITFEGVIGNDIDFSSCTLLTIESILSVISCLKDLTATGETKTLTLGSTNLAKLTDAQKAIATEKGWTLA